MLRVITVVVTSDRVAVVQRPNAVFIQRTAVRRRSLVRHLHRLLQQLPRRATSRRWRRRQHKNHRCTAARRCYIAASTLPCASEHREKWETRARLPAPQHRRSWPCFPAASVPAAMTSEERCRVVVDAMAMTVSMMLSSTRGHATRRRSAPPACPVTVPACIVTAVACLITVTVCTATPPVCPVMVPAYPMTVLPCPVTVVACLVTVPSCPVTVVAFPMVVPACPVTLPACPVTLLVTHGHGPFSS